MKRIFKVFLCFCLIASTMCSMWACDVTTTEEPKETTATTILEDPAHRPGSETTSSNIEATPNSTTAQTEPEAVPGETTAPTIPEAVPEETTAPSTPVGEPTRLPAKDWGGKEVIILGNDGGYYPQFTNFEIARDEMPDDVVGKAVWERNNSIKAKYNIVIKQELYTNASNELSNSYYKGEHLYDIAFVYIADGFTRAQNGQFKDMREIEYIDFSHPSWDKNVTEQLTICGRTFLSTSDLTIQNLDRVNVMWYNRELARQKGLGELEDLVDNNQWTLDRCNNILKSFADDADGDGLKGGKDDSFGLAVASCEYTSGFIIGGGFRLTTNRYGNVTFVEPDTNAESIMNKVVLFAYDKDITLFPENFGVDDSIWDIPLVAFGEGRALMYNSALSDMSQNFLDSVKFEFGYMPYPKYTSVQKEYYTIANMWNGSMVGIPATASEAETEFAGFALQALTEASTKTTYYAYYETKCKHQDSYDERCAEMLDLIFENVVYDIGMIYDLGRSSNQQNGLYSYIVFNMPKSGKNNYMNAYSRKDDAAKGQLADIISDFENIE